MDDKNWLQKALETLAIGDYEGARKCIQAVKWDDNEIGTVYALLGKWHEAVKGRGFNYSDDQASTSIYNSISRLVQVIHEKLAKMELSKLSLNVQAPLAHLVDLSEFGRFDTVVPEKLIYGKGLRSIAWLSVGLERQRAVARVVTPNTIGTGWLVAPGWLITCNHVLPDNDMCNASKVQFNYQEDINGKPFSITTFDLIPDSLVTDQSLDFSLVKLANFKSNDIDGWGSLPVAVDINLKKGDHVTIIQHPLGGMKKIGITENWIIGFGIQKVLYTTDTMPGSSGAPVFNNSWEVVGLHHGALPAPHNSGFDFLNEGTKLSVIRDCLGDKWPAKKNENV